MQDIIETCFRHHDMYHFWSQYEKRGCHAAAEYRNARRDGSLIQCPACFDYFAPYPEVERNTSHLISEDKVVWLCGECFVRKALPEEREIARNSPAWQQKLKESQDLEKEFIEAIKNEETLRVYVKDAFEDPAHYEQMRVENGNTFIMSTARWQQLAINFRRVDGIPSCLERVTAPSQ